LKICICIPCYEEGENLKDLLPAINKFIDEKVKVYIIDRVEQDKKIQAICKDNDAKYLNRKNDDSFGSAIRRALEISNEGNFDWLITMDADFSHSPSDLNKILNKINHNEHDIIIGSRYIEGGGTENNFILKLMSRTLNIVYAKYLKLNIKDVSNNFKAYRSCKISSIELVENNFEVVEELLAKCLFTNNNLKVIEIPTYFNNRLKGKSKRKLLNFIFTLFITLIRLKKLKNETIKT
jgi:dolichol-phosphate mannosyltransferase